MAAPRNLRGRSTALGSEPQVWSTTLPRQASLPFPCLASSRATSATAESEVAISKTDALSNPGSANPDGFSLANKPHGPARGRRVARSDERNGYARSRQEAAHRLSNAPRTDNGDAPNWFVFPHFRIQCRLTAEAHSNEVPGVSKTLALGT